MWVCVLFFCFLLPLGFITSTDEISSKLSSSDVSVNQHLTRCGSESKGKPKLSISLPLIYFFFWSWTEWWKCQSRAGNVAKGKKASRTLLVSKQAVSCFNLSAQAQLAFEMESILLINIFQRVWWGHCHHPHRKTRLSHHASCFLTSFKPQRALRWIKKMCFVLALLFDFFSSEVVTLGKIKVSQTFPSCDNGGHRCHLD